MPFAENKACDRASSLLHSGVCLRLFPAAILPFAGSALIAYAWFRSEPLAGFGGLTAMQLVQDGRAAEVMDYIDAVDAGVHA